MRALLSAVTVLLFAAHASAQPMAPGPGGGPMAPGPSQPHTYTPGGIGAGGVPVAPGPAARGVNMDRLGPGDVRLAPGAAGTIDTGLTPRAPTVAPSSGGVRGTIRSQRQRHKARPETVRRGGATRQVKK